MTAPSEPHAPRGETDLQRILRILLERRWAIVGALVVGAVLFLTWAPRQPRIYQATATIVVDYQAPQVFGGEVRDVVPVGPGQSYYMQDYLQTQRRVLTSDWLARRVVDRLGLLQDRQFWGGVLPVDREQGAEWFASSISAEPIFDTQIIAVTFRFSDARQAKRAVDGIVDAYIDSNLELRDTSNLNASRWLAGETDELRKHLADRELALYEFKRKNDLLSVSLEDRMNNTSHQIEKLSDALTEVRLRKVARTAEATELVKMVDANPTSIAPASGDPLGDLKRQLIDEERRLSELRARYEDAHPLVRQQSAKVKSVQSGLMREVEVQVRAAEARTREAIEEEKKIAAQLEQVKQEGLRITRLEVDYNKLKREAEALSKQYSMVQNRTKEAELASRVKGNNLRVLDYARLPGTPISPHLYRAGALSALLSLFAGLLLALGLDALDRSVKTQEDVETKLGLPFLGIMPRVAGGVANDRIVAQETSSPMAECCRLIRTNLMFAGLSKPLRRFLVTSAVAREGKTLTTVSLGIVLAQAGQRVLLIDSDLRRPRLHTALGVDGAVGMTNVLLGTVPLEEAIRQTEIPNLSVLCAGPIPPNPAELIDGPRFRELIDECAEKYERLLIDSPPAVPVTDPGILARYCDGVVLVLRSSRTRQDSALRAARNLLDVGARLVGVVLNDCDVNRGGYAQYGYGYGTESASRWSKLRRARG